MKKLLRLALLSLVTFNAVAGDLFTSPSTPPVITQNIVNEGTACPGVGAVGFTADGAILTCQDGLWKRSEGGLGYNQTWQLVSRVMNATYVNDTDKPILIVPSIYCNGSGNSWKRNYIYVNGIQVGQWSVADSDSGDTNTEVQPATYVVPVGQTYGVQTLAPGYCSIDRWSELR